MHTRTRLPLSALTALALAANLAAQSAAPAPAPEPAAATPARLAVPADQDEIVELDKMEVQASRVSEYAQPAGSEAGKAGIPLAENPQSITVVNRDLLDDIGVVRLEDALRTVAGVQTGGYYSNWDYFRIRGFDADFNTYIDGLRGGNGMGEETQGLQQVEVVKGPAALYGAGPLGGLVNLVSKRPTTETFTTVEATAGSYDYYQASIDFNRPLNAGKTVLFRLDTFYREQDSNIDYVGNERVYVAPSLTWKIGDSTSLTLLTRYRHITGTADMPLPAVGTVLPNPNGRISSDFYTGLAGSNQLEEDYYQLGYSFVHEFTDSLKLTQNFRYDTYEQTWDQIYYPVAFPAPYDTLYVAPYDYYQKWNDTVVDTRLDYVVEQGELTHNLVGGVDYFRKNTENWSKMGAGWSDPAQLTPINVYNPVYVGVPGQAMFGPYPGTDMEEVTGLYAQDHLQLPARVTFTLGGRYDFAETGGIKQEDFTGRTGLTWEFAPGQVAYATYSESFNPQSGTTVSGDPLSPETGDNIETGLRSRFLDGRLNTTAALFQVTRSDVASMTAPLSYVYTTTGEQRSKGVELDVRYTPVRGLELLAAYAYTDTEILSNNGVAEGDRMAGVPLHAFNVWGKYTLQGGALRGLGFGLGATYYSEQEGNRDYAGTPFELPAYTLWQTGLYYARGRFSAQLNVTNLFDQEYYVGAYDPLYVMPGEPRLVRLSTSWTF